MALTKGLLCSSLPQPISHSLSLYIPMQNFWIRVIAFRDLKAVGSSHLLCSTASLGLPWKYIYFSGKDVWKFHLQANSRHHKVTHTHCRRRSPLVQFLHFLVAFLASINVNTFKAINNLSRQTERNLICKREKRKKFSAIRAGRGEGVRMRVYGLERRPQWLSNCSATPPRATNKEKTQSRRWREREKQQKTEAATNEIYVLCGKMKKGFKAAVLEGNGNK